MQPRTIVFILISVVLVGSVGARILFAKSDGTLESTVAGSEESGSRSNLAGNSLVAGDPSGGGSERSGSESRTEPESVARETLPIVSEASFFGLIGFALGYTSRKLVKIGFVVIALAFVGLQALSFSGVVTIDWQRLIDIVNAFVLNINQNDSVGQILKDRIPSAGALVGGYFLGFRKG